MTLSIYALISIIVLSVLLGILVGIISFRVFLNRVLLPNVAEALREENIPKKYAKQALNQYHCLLSEVCKNFNDSEFKSSVVEANDKLLLTLTDYVDNPTSFIEGQENTNG